MSVIRVRSANRDVSEVRDGCFVEICDDEDNVACVVYRATSGEIKVIMPDDEKELKHYSSIFDVKFCSDVVDVEQTVVDNTKV